MATRPSPPQRARERERELVRATRALFDERGMLDAPVEEIAREAGIARGLIYRSFSSKEELFVLAVTDYLAELETAIAAATAGETEPIVRLERLTEAYARYCLRYPAFLDACISLMHRPALELSEIVSDSIWLRLGQGMARCLDHSAAALRAGTEAGVWNVEDADYTANVLWTQGLGLMHLARIGVGVRSMAPGVPALFPVAPEQIVRTCIESALANVRTQRVRPDF
ncbi:MAG: TetR/AcrR family transcriptional regulator [Solirubrobacteraceae bacterium]